MDQFSPVTDNLLLCPGIKSADVHVGIVDRFKTSLVERNQIIDPVHLFNGEEGVDTVACSKRTRN